MHKLGQETPESLAFESAQHSAMLHCTFFLIWGPWVRIPPGAPPALHHRGEMARPAGFEPAATGLEGRCSIQLS